MKARCECGCDQPPVASMRMRLCMCRCGRKIRDTRQNIALGMLTCSCGGQLEPVCLLDQSCLPGDEGEMAWQRFMTLQAQHEVLSERARNGAKTRRIKREARALRPVSDLPF